MAHHKRTVTSGNAAEAAIERELGFFVVLVDWFRSAGLLEEVGARLPLRKRGDGYTGEDVFCVLLALFASGRTCGIKRFLKDTRAFGPQLAAIFGRKKWPSQAAMSRALRSLETEVVEAFVQWLLVDVAGRFNGRRDLESWHDRNGEEWAAFYWDDRVTPVRLRALPEGPELPEPIRRLDRIAAPGYPGRKTRADSQVCVSKVLGGGNWQWKDVRVGAGNGSVPEQQAHAHLAVAQCAGVDKAEPGRRVLISDGVGGGYTQMAVGTASPVRFLTRFADYRSLKSVEGEALLASTTWEPVVDSCSGPVREATEFGSTVSGGGGRVRLVVSRYRVVAGKKVRGVGWKQGEWVYELFATDVPVESFYACDIVCLYYSRCGIESAFSCENREFAAGHLYHTDPDGQELCLGISAFVWNMQMALGLEMVEAMGELPSPPSRDLAPKRTDPSTPKSTSLPDTQPHPEPDSATPVAEEPSATVGQTSVLSSAEVPWSEKLKARPNWTWDSMNGRPRCPAGHLMTLKRVIDRASGEKTYRFRGSAPLCARCSPREGCDGARSKHYRRELDIQLTKDQAAQVTRNPETPERPPIPAPDSWRPPCPMPPRSLTPPRMPQLLLSEIRHLIPELCLETHIVIHIRPGHEAPKPSRFLALLPAVRQRRRKTKTQRRQWNALPDDAVVKTHITAPKTLADFLNSPPPRATKTLGGSR